MNRVPALTGIVLLTVLVVGCADAGPGPAETTSPPADTEASTEPEPEPEPDPEYLPAGDLPDAHTLEEVDGRTIPARPFADFAVGTGSGVWVSGVGPGIVRYDGASGAITARTSIPGDVVQALEATRTDVVVPSLNPSVLFRLDATTGAVRTKVRLPASPLVEGVVGADGDTAYVLVEPSAPLIAVVRGDSVVDEIEAPEGAVAVRAGSGSLWVPTSRSTIERYSVADGTWSSTATGPDPRFFDLGFGAAWVMNQGDGSITRVDAATGEAETIPVTGVPIGGGDLTVGADGVWLRTDSSVLRIDPDTRRVTHLIELPPGSGSVAAVPGSLWITNHDHFAVHRVPLPLPT